MIGAAAARRPAPHLPAPEQLWIDPHWLADLRSEARAAVEPPPHARRRPRAWVANAQLWFLPSWLQHLQAAPGRARGQMLFPAEWVVRRTGGLNTLAPDGPAPEDLPTPSPTVRTPLQRKLRFPRRCSELPRARSLSARRLSRRERQESKTLGLFPAGWDAGRPQTRADCEGGQRPCPWVACRYNLYLDVADNGTLKVNFPDRDPLEMPPDWSCVLDVADRVQAGDPVSLDEVGKGMNLGIERVRQLSAIALQHARVKKMWEDNLVKIRLPPRPRAANEQGGMLARAPVLARAKGRENG